MAKGVDKFMLWDLFYRIREAATPWGPPLGVCAMYACVRVPIGDENVDTGGEEGGIGRLERARE